MPSKTAILFGLCMCIMHLVVDQQRHQRRLAQEIKHIDIHIFEETYNHIHVHAARHVKVTICALFPVPP